LGKVEDLERGEKGKKMEKKEKNLERGKSFFTKIFQVLEI
jgi:hypothetical protein